MKKTWIGTSVSALLVALGWSISNDRDQAIPNAQPTDVAEASEQVVFDPVTGEMMVVDGELRDTILALAASRSQGFGERLQAGGNDNGQPNVNC